MSHKFLKGIILIGLVFFTFPFFCRASVLRFNIDPSYDFQNRSQIKSSLLQMGQNAYFYVEDDYYDTLTVEKKQALGDSLNNLSQEFDATIYPQLTKIFGSEWKPGIDEDPRITILIFRMKEGSAGYFNSADEYPKSEVPISNEREMIYLSVDFITSSLNKSYLAHEFTHLVAFNQKDRALGVAEETWLNEGRAEMSPTLLLYDQNYLGSNLQKRVKTFIQNPDDSLTEWRNLAADYGVLNVFFQYVIDSYGKGILVDSLHSDKVGIASLNEALKKNGFNKNFSQVFDDWLVALAINDCSVGVDYCYKNPNLLNLRVVPKLNYLPSGSESTLTVTNYTKEWAGNWFKFVGGQGIMKMNFVGNERINFEVPYLLQDSSGKYKLSFLLLDSSQNGTVFISGFGSQYDSLILIPSAQNKTSGFSDSEPYYQFIWSASITSEAAENNEVVKSLLSQIEFLKTEVAKLQAQIAAILRSKENSCQGFGSNLYFGMMDNSQVRCLQEFLKSQGSAIYPEAQVTGNFLSLTQQAVIRFQEKYSSEILAPSGLSKGTGFVGVSTRAKINQLLGK